MACQVMVVRDVQQAVQQSRIPKIDFRGFDLAFTDIFMPGLQLTNHKGAGQDIEIRSDRLVGQAHGSAKFRGIHGLTVVVG